MISEREMSMISVSIVEDDNDIRNGITKYLSSQPGFKVLSSDPTAELFLARMEEGPRPDIVLMDIQLPGMSGIDGIRILKRKWPQVDIAMLTVYHDEEKIFQSLCAGASGYLLKNTPLVELRDALTELNAGGAPMSPQIARKVIQYFSPKPKEDDVLTAKERQVVQGLVDGLSYKLIAAQMNVSIDAIRFHIKNIYKKLHVNSKGELVSKFIRGQI